MSDLDGYGYDDTPARRESDHDRVIGSGAWTALTVFALLMCWADARLPPWAAFLLTWALVLPVTFGMAAWKRAWYAWAAWWGLVALCAFTAVADLATGLLSRPFGLVSDVSAVVFVFLWYWLIRMPRRQPAVAASVSHVVHHHVLHPAPGWAGAEVEAPAAVGELGQVAPRAITAGAVTPDGVAARLGALVARARQDR